MNKLLLFSIIYIASMLTACAKDISMNDNLSNQLIGIAAEIIKKEYPDSFKETFKHQYSVIDMDEHWVVSWKARKGKAEGAPVVFINKETLKVTRFYHTQ